MLVHSAAFVESMRVYRDPEFSDGRRRMEITARGHGDVRFVVDKPATDPNTGAHINPPNVGDLLQIRIDL